MPSSLHVSLPDEMRAYVDLRTNGKTAYATPSEYVRALIRDDMQKESERLYVFGEIFKGLDDLKQGRFTPLSALDDMISSLEKEEPRTIQ
jgi:antitoxin ParD1/3/4